jgi:hypothetical protein
LASEKFFTKGEAKEIEKNPHSGGRWPANLILDEAAAQVLDAMSGERKSDSANRKPRHTKARDADEVFFGQIDKANRVTTGYSDTGGASRYFKVISQCGHEKTEADGTYAGKNTASKSGNSNIDGYGSKPTGRFLTDSISIIRTGTRSIMTLPILSVSNDSLIGICTIATEKHTQSLMASNIESVRVAANGEASITTSDGAREPIKGTASLVSVTPSESGEKPTESTTTPICESTEADRFFYCAKASRAERNQGLEGLEAGKVNRYGEQGQGPLPQQTPRVERTERNVHPCVKPLALMKYLCRLTKTPTGGVVLDPFMGSGSTGVAAVMEGREFIGIEMDTEHGYFEIAKRRIEAAENEPRQLAMAAD